MDLIQQYIAQNDLTKQNVLRLVDEYTLYAFYLGFTPELGVKYRSPIRPDDEHPSFTVFESRSPYYEFMWKDHGYGVTGTIFRLLEYLYPECRNLNTLLHMIDQDFELGLGKGYVERPKIVRFDKPTNPEPVAIRIKVRLWNEKDLKFWGDQGISLQTLEHYQVFPIAAYWTKESQQAPVGCRGLAYAYVIGNYYKIYQPYEDEFKFINNLPDTYIEGFHQLDWDNNDLLLITKSMKECMWFRENLGIEAVAGKSESQLVPEPYIRKFKRSFRRMAVFLDPDPAGYKQAWKYKELYGLDWYTILPCMLTGSKDPTDHNKDYGLDASKKLIKSILAPCYN